MNLCTSSPTLAGPGDQTSSFVVHRSLAETDTQQTVKLTPTSSGLPPKGPICRQSVRRNRTKPPAYPFIVSSISKSIATTFNGRRLSLTLPASCLPGFSTASVRARLAPSACGEALSRGALEPTRNPKNHPPTKNSHDAGARGRRHQAQRPAGGGSRRSTWAMVA